MNRGIVASMRFVAAVLASAYLVMGGAIAWAATAGQFHFVAGDVRVERAGQMIVAKKGDEVLEGDVIATGKPGDAQLRMTDSALIAVKADSRLRIDQYTFRPANAADDNAVLSLLGGTMRAFTGALVNRNRDRFHMRTLTANVGIRGSGNILNASVDGTTLNYTITGAHSVTSTDAQGVTRTLVSYPGQTIQVLPGQAPQFIPTPPFILSVASPPKAPGKGEKAGGEVRESSSEDSNAAAAPAATNVVATVTAGGDAQLAAQQASVQSFANSLVQTRVFDAAAIGRFSIPLTPGFAGVLFQQSLVLDALTGNVPASTFVFDSAGNLVFIGHALLATFFNGPGGAIPGFTPTTYEDARITFRGGVAQDNYRNPANTIVLGRWQGGSVDVSPNDGSTGVSYDLGPRSVAYLVYRATPFGVLASLTGTTSYVLAAASRPTDSFGNVGVLNSAFVNVNFTSHVVDEGLTFTINGQTISLGASSLAFTTGSGGVGFFVIGAGVPPSFTISCTGTNCHPTGYTAAVNTNFAGPSADAIAMDYRVSEIRPSGEGHPNVISGNAALVASAPPTVGVVLPVTGTATYSLSNLTNLSASTNQSVALSAASGQLNANFTARTVDASLSFAASSLNQTWSASETGAAIHGVGFSAQSGGISSAGVAPLNVSCAGSGCPGGTLVGRFDGFFTGPTGAGATVQFSMSSATDNLGGFAGSADFVRVSGGVAKAADPLAGSPSRDRRAGILGTLSQVGVSRIAGLAR